MFVRKETWLCWNKCSLQREGSSMRKMNIDSFGVAVTLVALTSVGSLQVFSYSDAHYKLPQILLACMWFITTYGRKPFVKRENNKEPRILNAKGIFEMWLLERALWYSAKYAKNKNKKDWDQGLERWSKVSQVSFLLWSVVCIWQFQWRYYYFQIMAIQKI